MEQKLYEALSNLVRAWEHGDGEDVDRAVMVAKKTLSDAGRNNPINVVIEPLIESYRAMSA